MELARHIGELARLTRRLRHVRGVKGRAQRLLASPRFAPPTAAPTSFSSSPTSDTRGSAAEGDETVEGRLSLAQRRQRSASQTSREANVRGARVLDELLLRRIPVAVSLVERSWGKLVRKQREWSARRERGQESAVHPHDATNVKNTAASTALSLPDNGEESDVDAKAFSRGDATRSWRLQVMSDNQAFTPLARSPAPPASQQQIEAVCLLLQLLHSVEEVRRQHLQEKLSAAQHRCDAADKLWQNFQRDFASQLRYRHRSPAKHQKGALPLRAEDAALLHETADALQRRRRVARDDFALVRSSLLTRSFVSARLWRLLLRESVWTAVVAEHRRAAAASAGPCTAVSQSTVPPVSRLLLFCLALTRIALGILRDYVQGGQLSRQAPRFVVSLPSRAFRARVTAVDEDDGRTPVSAAINGGDESSEKTRKDKQSSGQMEGISTSASAASPPPAAADEEPDLLFSMLQNAVSTSDTASHLHDEVAASSAVLHNEHRPAHSNARSMRWIPPHTAEVMPLVTDTLALHSLVLPELEVPALLELGCAPELMSLCVTLQHMASMTLTLAQDGGHAKESDRSNSRNRASLHRTLHALEDAMTAVGAGVVDQLVAECQTPVQERRDGGATVAGRLGRLSPADAARLAVQLHRLRLLPAGDARVAQLLTKLLTDIFPELRTQTSHVLHEKARQSSLLAFATRPHRHKLYQQHGRKNAEKYLLETVVQQARLQQRQLAAALREQHVNEAHVQALRTLSQSLPPNDLIELFQLFARHGVERTEGRHSAPTAADVWVAGCLFLAETVFISSSAQRSASSSAVGQEYSLSQLAMLWDAATSLFPHIRTRRTQQLAQQRATAPGRPRAFSSVHTESIIWSTFAAQILSGVNAALAERLQTLEVQRQAESTAMRRSGGQQQREILKRKDAAGGGLLTEQTVSINSVVALAAGVLEYADQDEAVRDASGGVLGEYRSNAHAPSSLQPVQQSVRTLARLLHSLVLHDRSLWHQVRRLPASQRDAVERQLRECFHSLGMLDDTTTQALSVLNREDGVGV
ncbi:hypothetical protein ABB37_03965 [Leptomonas pyrrhocoris]|uniref:Uncharacterized protein n=1 Tax=Leptomonas pyrrhocoris TaxID=157538 RepID=A0A0N0VFQ3_LEPPY|nr:hypothetical protein ABB37_03965 [Leptomonas pyrrhocoris]KPA81644.1 hypothetical protein ABB37_03965 [Leptomonas pyrrhocoris]|eukprot:XP_015660083.1 hypothetical protein ABB37_03965 [Leptomonas pyrrhocoris]